MVRAGLAPSEAPVSVAGELLAFEADRVAISIDAPRDGVVVLNEVDYPGWTVVVDGEAATPITVNHMLRGVIVPKGKHVIVWSFSPRGWGWLVGLWISGWGFCAYAGWSAWWSARRSRRQA
jgi:uncharacterized membrane protein YfhO